MSLLNLFTYRDGQDSVLQEGEGRNEKHKRRKREERSKRDKISRGRSGREERERLKIEIQD
jgi:hypothetical protein